MNPADYEALLANPEPFVTHDDPAVRRLAIATLATAATRGTAARLPTVDASRTEGLLSATLAGDRDPRVRAEAAEALAGFAGAAGVLLAATEDPDGIVREAAVTALGEIADRDAVNRLVVLASTDPDRLVREAAVAALGAIGDPAALPVLLDVVATAAPQIRRRAVVALTVFDEPGVEDALRKAALDRNPMVREVAEMVVGRPHTWEPIELREPEQAPEQ